MTQSNGVTVKPITAAVGAEISGVDLTRLSADEFDVISDAFNTHSALLIRGQVLSVDDLVAFSKRFGDLDEAPVNENGKTAIEGYPELYVVSNIPGDDGKPIGSMGAGEAVWHTDMSYLEVPPKASMLYALEVPEEGGDTWVCGMQAAYDTLPDDLRAQIEDKTIKHDGTYNSAGFLRQGLVDQTDAYSAPGTLHPAVCAHPVTGEKALFLGRQRLSFVDGMLLEESEKLLDEVWQHATRAEHSYGHHWQVGDLLMWDNRTTLHRRDAFDPSARRLMHRTQIRGDARPKAAV